MAYTRSVSLADTSKIVAGMDRISAILDERLAARRSTTNTKDAGHE